MHAVQSYLIHKVKRFFDKGVENFNAVNPNGFTALMFAVRTQDKEMVDFLQEQTNEDLTVAKIMVAARSGNFFSAKKFAIAGHDLYSFRAGPQLTTKPHIETDYGHGPGGWTVVMHAVQSGRERATESFLEDYIEGVIGAAGQVNDQADVDLMDAKVELVAVESPAGVPEFRCGDGS